MILLNESVLKNCEVTEQPRERERESKEIKEKEAILTKV
jgi:hypothetical protein